jgi:hypothetical protein
MTSSSSSSPDDLLKALDAFRTTAAGRASDYLSLADDIDRARDNVLWSSSTGVGSYPSIYVGEIFRISAALGAGAPDIASARSVVQFVTSGSTATAMELSIRAGSRTIVFPPSPRETQAQRLDSLLSALWNSDNLVSKRRDAWRTLQLSTPAACEQACHSHRELLTAILDKCAPASLVERAPWWRPPPETDGKVSKRQKLKFLIVRTDDTALSDDVLADLDRQVATAMDAHQRAIGLAHGKEAGSFQAGKAAMVDLEDVLLTLLTYRQSNSAHKFAAT